MGKHSKKRGSGITATNNIPTTSERANSNTENFQKPSTTEFNNSVTSVESKDPNSTKIDTTNLSPAKMTIGMFEGLTKAYIMAEKPFTEDVVKEGKQEDNKVKPEQFENPEDNPNTIKESSQLNEVTLDELKEKIKKILSVPLDENEIEDIKEDNLDELHDQNMQILKQKLRLDDSEKTEDLKPETSEPMNVQQLAEENNHNKHVSSTNKGAYTPTTMTKMILTEEVVRMSVPFKTSKRDNTSKYNIEETRKIFTRGSPRNVPKKKSILGHRIMDLTEETLSIPRQPTDFSKIDSSHERIPKLDVNEAYNTYYMERDIVELAKKAKPETENEELRVEYHDVNSNKERGSFFGGCLRFLSCGLISGNFQC